MRHKNIELPMRVFDFILRYKSEHDGNSPSVRDIMENFGYNSTSAAWRYLDILEDMGKIKTRKRFRVREIEVVGGYQKAIYERMQEMDGEFALNRRETPPD